ncbi:hypothetical protein HKD21_13955 [Gluconobacter cerevisiae]|uniref:Uncharacterized protein n=1 Tax=Gluconobacter cerevisiae TaxID=1379734 RepID=A0ABR9YGY8_9PROT|nr:hypothetical protein [Gluconobacter cerevisiae]MBF0877930.1 hypothetical protein [Gluconobacter cerevisiae]
MSEDIWLPGSFTKNFSWGKDQGLRQLYENIRIGFDNKLEAVPRDVYRERVTGAGRPDFIPLNFFLFNTIKNGVDYLAIDELVFQALTSEHSERFDKLALFAFNFSYAGTWKGARTGQRYPALWAKHYIIDRVCKDYHWDTTKISAEDIEDFLKKSLQFKAKTYRKISTNLNFMYEIGGINEYKTKRIERWWVDALFLAIDRIISDLESKNNTQPTENTLPNLLLKSKFLELTGVSSPEKSFAMAHLMSLYFICAGLSRFNSESVKEKISVVLPDYHYHTPNDPRPQGALHPTNPRILKTIPRDCAELAKKVGFEIVQADDLDSFNPTNYINERAKNAVKKLEQKNIKPTMSAEELHKLTRGE